jgi:hypothetical protein
MLLIDETYFTGELSLPNLPSLGGSGGVALALRTVGGKSLAVFVDKYVSDYLVRLFGRELTGVFLEEVAKSTPGQLWVDLRGSLLFERGSYRASPLANYVYFHVMRDARTLTTQAGEADPDFDCAENAGNGGKLVRAWNEMADMTVEAYGWFCRHAGDYEGYAGDRTGRRAGSLMRRINMFGL